MISVYGRALREVFTAELASKAPEYRPSKGDPEPIFPGQRSFVHKVDEAFWAWLTVIPSPKDDSFTLEMGWSRLARYPQGIGRASLLSPFEAAKEPEYLCRIGKLLGVEDVWWDVEKFLRSEEGKEIFREIPGALQSNPQTRVLVSARAALSLFLRAGVPALNAAA